MKEFLIGVTVMPKKEVLDTQGRTVEDTLKREGLSVLSARVGKYVELKISGQTVQDAEKTAHSVASELLCNSLIETFDVKVIGS